MLSAGLLTATRCHDTRLLTSWHASWLQQGLVWNLSGYKHSGLACQSWQKSRKIPKSKVIEFGTNRTGICDFLGLLVTNSNFGCVLHDFHDTLESFLSSSKPTDFHRWVYRLPLSTKNFRCELSSVTWPMHFRKFTFQNVLSKENFRVCRDLYDDANVNNHLSD